MIPVVTPQEMNAIDSAAPEPVEVLIDRAARAVAASAIRIMGGTYGRRVLVACGPGNNGADGRVAAAYLAQRGVSVSAIDIAQLPREVPKCSLFIDAAFGTGLSRPWDAPGRGGASTVLAVDIASGVSGLTGATIGAPLPADHTITFAALKPGHLLSPGAGLAGQITIADIGLDISTARTWLVEPADCAFELARRRRSTDSHKWKSAVWAIAGNDAMRGAARLVTSAAYRAGCGYVRLSSPGSSADNAAMAEVVQVGLVSTGWSEQVLREASRFGAIVVGPGLGRQEDLRSDVVAIAERCNTPVIFDADALAVGGPSLLTACRHRSVPAVLTPHDGEFAALSGDRPGEDRIASARDMASRSNTVVVLKGACTVIAEPAGEVRLSVAGDQRLATAGSGDVLSGIIAALLAQGHEPFTAAAMGAEIHGIASLRANPVGMVASDLVRVLPALMANLDELRAVPASHIQRNDPRRNGRI